jgi:hypothetical protein
VKTANRPSVQAVVGPPEVLPPTTDLRTFLMRLHRLCDDAGNIEWPDAVAAMNAVALVDILRERMMRPNAAGEVRRNAVTSTGLLGGAE